MMMVGYDGSNVCRAALDLAVEHAKAFGAGIVVVASLEKGTEDERGRIIQLEKELAAVKDQVEQQGTDCDTHLLIRGLSPAEDLVEYAEEKGAKQIFIGIRRRSKVGKMLFGSTAQYVILNASCPVVTVK